jgi:RimJ/RimL family protein N-acetyltransferase
MKKLDFKMAFGDIYFLPVQNKNINLGWLSWMNNPRLTKFLDSDTKQYTNEDLKKYLDTDTSKAFLACYRLSDDMYLGNLRVYELSSGIFSYGILIGEKFQGLGYGTKLCKVAVHLAFNSFNGDLVVASSKIENQAPSAYKTKVGFCIADDIFVARWKLERHFKNFPRDPIFYMDKKIFSKSQSQL